MKRIIVLWSMLLCLVLGAVAQPKYIFYFIGDGMGQNQVQAAELYMGELEGKIGRVPLQMTQLPYVGMASTFSASNGITDSSAAGTCLATGKKTNNGMLGMTPDGKHPQTIAERLKEQGWLVGIMTSVSIDHATPGAFYARVKNRNDYYAIGQQLAESQFDFFGGGTFYQPYHKTDDKRLNTYKHCEAQGYTFCHGLREMRDFGYKSDKVILIQEHEGLDIRYLGEGRLPYAIDRKNGDLTLPQITRSAIDFLHAKGKPFFMMVEGGQIDWACHGNDGATAIHEVIDFDKAIREAYDFYLQHPDETLIVITADHETGGLALGNKKYTLELKLLKNQQHSVNAISEQIKALSKQYGKKLKFEQVKEVLQDGFGLYTTVEVSPEDDKEFRALYKQMLRNHGKDAHNLYASVDGLADKAMRLLNKKAHLGWTTSSHSASAVPVFAVGVGAEHFTGFYDNSDIMPRILKIAEGNK